MFKNIFKFIQHLVSFHHRSSPSMSFFLSTNSNLNSLDVFELRRCFGNVFESKLSPFTTFTLSLSLSNLCAVSCTSMLACCLVLTFACMVCTTTHSFHTHRLHVLARFDDISHRNNETLPSLPLRTTTPPPLPLPVGVLTTLPVLGKSSPHPVATGSVSYCIDCIDCIGRMDLPLYLFSTPRII